MSESQSSSILENQENVDNKDKDRDKKRVRRSRKDDHQRSFKCKYCEKSYLSNAALYTHVKNKHSSSEKGKKSQNFQAQFEAERIQEEPQFFQHCLLNEEKNSETPANMDSLQRLRNIMKKYYPERNKASSIRHIVEGLNEKQMGFIEPLLQYWQQNRLITLTKENVTIDLAISYFLMLMNARVSSSCIHFLVRAFYYIREGLLKEIGFKTFGLSEKVANLPNYFNKLILNKRVPPESADEDELMSNTDLICKILENFGNWLYQEKFTDYKVIPNY